MVKVNKPTWMNGNVIGSFYNGNLWSNNIHGIDVAIYNKDKIVDDKIFEAAIEFKFKQSLRLFASLKTNEGILKSDTSTLDNFEISCKFIIDENFVTLKISFDIKNDNIEIKKEIIIL